MLWMSACTSRPVCMQGFVCGGEGVIRMLRNDTIRSILESGGFVLEEVLQDAGFTLKVSTADLS